MKSLELNHWLDNTKSLMKEFSFLTFNHVYRELNTEANTLFKLALGAMDAMDGGIHFSLFFFCSYGLWSPFFSFFMQDLVLEHVNWLS